MNRIFKTVAVAIFSVCVVSWQLQAGVVNITQGSTSGYTMTDGNTYVIKTRFHFQTLRREAVECPLWTMRRSFFTFPPVSH